MRHIKTKNWIRVSKAKAKKLYNAGEDILIVPCKVHPENQHGIGVMTSISYWEHPTFEKFLNEFCWYNCRYNEWGKYPAFYERRQG